MDCREIFGKHLRTGVRKGAQLVRNEAIRNVSGRVLRRRTGNLARNIYARSGLIRTGAQIRTGTKVFYGAAWETGFHRRAYTVVPKRARALRIPLRDGTVIFRKSATIPAQSFKPKKWLKPAADKVLPEINRIIADEMVAATLECIPRRVGV